MSCADGTPDLHQKSAISAAIMSRSLGTGNEGSPPGLSVGSEARSGDNWFFGPGVIQGTIAYNKMLRKSHSNASREIVR